MKESLAVEYLDLRNQQDIIELKIKAVEEKYLTELKDEKTEVVMKLDIIKEKMLRMMETESVKTYECNGKNISRVVVESLKIVDDEKVMKDFSNPAIAVKISKVMGWKLAEVMSNLIVKTLKVKEAKKVIESLQSSDGLKIKGTEIQTSEQLRVT